ncbi:MAG: hypothetical protein KJZ79_23560 [Bryobacteraceae bacterium]|nr:hypothetical protein [Bryobacteraceae bacterium]
MTRRTAFGFPLLLVKSTQGWVQQRQGRFRRDLPPLEIYPSDGRLTGHLRRHFVFLAPNGHELVISFPLNCDLGFKEPESNTEDPEGRLTERMKLALDCEPDVEMACRQLDGGRFSYEYRLSNGAGAHGPIGWFKVALPAIAEIQWQSPVKWRARGFCPTLSQNQGLMEMKQGPPAWSEAQEPRLAAADPCYIGWMGGEPIAPGATLNGFALTALKRPGLVRAYAQGLYNMVSIRNPTPELVKAYLYPFSAYENNSLSTLVAGPKFAPDTPVVEITADFLRCLRDAVRGGELSDRSEFCRQFTAQAPALTERSKGEQIRILDRLSAAASSGLEQRIATTIRAAL